MSVVLPDVQRICDTCENGVLNSAGEIVCAAKVEDAASSFISGSKVDVEALFDALQDSVVSWDSSCDKWFEL